MSCNLKKRADKPYQYQSDQRFFCEYTYVKHISDHLRRSQKQTNFKSHSLTKNFFGLNILAIYFPLKLIFCTARKSFFDLNFLSLSSESYSCFHKKNCWSFYRKCAIECWLIGWLFQVITFWLVHLNLIKNPLKYC